MDLDLHRLIRRDARRIAGTYLFVAAVWIWGSDFLLQQWFPDQALSVVLQTVKGIAFVLITAGLLYLSVRGQLLQRTTIEQILRSTRSLGEAIFHSANDAILVLNERQEVRDANLKAETLYGRLRSSLIGMPLKSLLASSTNLQIAEEQRTVQEKGSARWETRHLKSDGTTFPAEVSATVLDWEGEPHSVYVVRDITRRVEYQKRIERLNRTYAVLSDVNQMIVRVRDVAKLFREACRIAVEKGGFRLAWVGEVDVKSQTIRPVSSAGPAAGYIEGSAIHIDEGDSSRGPTATAVSRGSYVVCNDIENDPRMAAWRRQAGEFGLRASAAFPIKGGDDVAYVLNVYAEEAGHFDDHEIELLDEMASDITFALSFNDTLRRLEENEAITSAFMDNLPGVAFIKDADLRHRFVNREFERTLNLRMPDLLGKRVDELLPGPEADRMLENDRSVLERGRPILTEELLRVGDATRVFLASKFPIRRPDGSVWLGGVAVDITERKQAAERLQYQAQLLSQMEQVAKIGAWEFDPATGKGTWTPGVARIHDLDPMDETSVQRGLSFYAGEDRTRIETAVRETVEKAQPYDLELQLTSSRGVRKWVHTMGYPLVQDGRVIKVYGSFQDITDRKNVDAEIIEANRRLRALAQQLVTAREEERKAIAREIHDELGQELTAIRMDLSMASVAPSLEDVRGQLQSASGVADRAIATIRRLARDLRPDVLDQLGLVEALKWLASEHEAHARMSCRVRIVGDDPQLDDTSATTLFRALQESLTNIVRHAQARSVDVLIQTRTETVELEVLDDGRGPDLEKLSRPSGVGIIGIRERVEALGGSFEIGRRLEGGTRVLIRLPKHDHPHPEARA